MEKTCCDALNSLLSLSGDRFKHGSFKDNGNYYHPISVLHAPDKGL